MRVRSLVKFLNFSYFRLTKLNYFSIVVGAGSNPVVVSGGNVTVVCIHGNVNTDDNTCSCDVGYDGQHCGKGTYNRVPQFPRTLAIEFLRF